MRNISLSFLLAAACICCIQACKNGISTGTLSTSATYPLSDSTDAELELKIDVEYIISGPGAAAVRSINSSIILGLFGEQYEGSGKYLLCRDLRRILVRQPSPAGGQPLLFPRCHAELV
mgnify:CR=1 FL=1